jgi:hypothetical protein
MVLILVQIYLLDPNDAFTTRNACQVLMMISLIFTIITTKVIISTMAKMSMSPIQLESFIPFIYFYIQYCYKGDNKYLTQKYCFIAVFVLSLVLYVKFVRTSIVQITNHLNIFCFSIKRPETDKKKD